MNSSIKLEKVEFCFGNPNSRDLPESDLPEIAVVGRSNVGKSTFLNRITQRRDLARVSSRPGKTLEFNYYRVAVHEPKMNPFWLVDLPGFGYAKLSLAQRKNLNREIARFLVERSYLRIVCLLNDIRRDPEEDELNIRELCLERDVGLLVVLTKVDKLNQKDKARRIKELTKAYSLEQQDFIFTGEGMSINEWWNRISLQLS
jgi:GTP-binding protein